ncbi:MAG: CBM20 domain-containing protein, partial [Bacteroidota bacterium]
PAHLGLRGSEAPLSWDRSTVLELKDGRYSCEVHFPKGVKEVEFKFVLFDNDRKPEWENIDNRSLILEAGQSIESVHQWNVEQLVDVAALPLLQPAQLMADYALIETMVLEVHPGTYRYRTKAEIAEVLAELKAKFQQPMTQGEAYLAMSKVTAALQCDHTKVGFNNQKRIINSIIHRQADKLPFTFRWIDEKMIVEYDATKQQQLARGTEIVSINGLSANEIREAMWPYIGADGGTDNNRWHKMEVNAYDFRYNAFDVFFPLLFPDAVGSLTLETKAPETTQSKTIEAQTLTREVRSDLLVSRYGDFPATCDDMWDFEITEDGVGLLTINSFNLFGWKK